MDDRYNKILGLDKYQPQTEWVCFLPWVSEFGWYIMNHVKRVHGYNHPKKIVCIKKGHECLFPTATEFFYGWTDTVPDKNKGGVVKYKYNEAVKRVVKEAYGDNITFIDPAETSWAEKTSLAHHTFVPQPRENHDFNIDIVITPRLRSIDTLRNYPKQWQVLTNLLINRGYRVAVCGHKGTSVAIKGAHYYSWNYIDVDTDVEMISKAKLVISQETGLAYLTMMCKKPLIVVDNCHTHVALKHQDPNVYFNNYRWPWNEPNKFLKVVSTVISAHSKK